MLIVYTIFNVCVFAVVFRFGSFSEGSFLHIMGHAIIVYFVFFDAMRYIIALGVEEDICEHLPSSRVLSFGI